MESLWARLSLRVQAAIAVVAPCMAVALFAAIYFPRLPFPRAYHSGLRLGRSHSHASRTYVQSFSLGLERIGAA